MAELGEMVKEIAFGDENWSCPFDHVTGKTHDKENVMPPIDGKKTNNAKTLSTNLENESFHQENLPIVVWGKNYEAQYTAHHILPGNGGWRDACKLLKWVDEAAAGTLIVKDIGYCVNHYTNGVDLPSIHGLGDTAWTASTEGFQKAYAFAAMEAAKQRRQFHDTHPAYNDFVFNVLDKIALKMDDKVANGNVPGCGKKNCGGGASGPKYDPPYGLLGRLAGVALRLEGYLTCDARDWRKPIMTSRFALMYKKDVAGQSITQQESKDELEVGQFAY